jgi:hypothetical protein
MSLARLNFSASHVPPSSSEASTKLFPFMRDLRLGRCSDIAAQQRATNA